MGIIADLLMVGYLELETRYKRGEFNAFMRNSSFFSKFGPKIAATTGRSAEEREIRLKNQGEMVGNYTSTASLIFIDSNIWMNETYHTSISRFCQLYAEFKAPFTFHGEQYAEIQKIRKKAEKTADENAKSGAASSAVRLIRDLAKQGHLVLEEQVQSTSHVDDYIVGEAQTALSAGKKFLLVTDDVELQTRVFSIKPRQDDELCEVLTGPEFNSLFYQS